MSLLLNYYSEYVRLALRAYFTVFFLLLGLIGDQCCSCRVKLRLMKERTVPINLMTGWLSGFIPIWTLKTLRKLPGGWLGVIMILSSVLALVSDLAVSGLVKTVQVPSRCPFGTGLIIPTTPFVPLTGPPNNGAPYYAVAQAQLTSQINGGLSGIYWKVNRDPKFRADAEDLVGNWICDDLQNDLQYIVQTPLLRLSSMICNNEACYMVGATLSAIVSMGTTPGLTSSHGTAQLAMPNTRHSIFEFQSILRLAPWTQR